MTDVAVEIAIGAFGQAERPVDIHCERGRRRLDSHWPDMAIFAARVTVRTGAAMTPCAKSRRPTSHAARPERLFANTTPRASTTSSPSGREHVGRVSNP